MQVPRPGGSWEFGEAPGIAEEGGPGLPLETSCDGATKEAGRVPTCDLGLSTVKDFLDAATACGLQKFYPPEFFLLMNHSEKKKKRVNSALYQFSLALWETPVPTPLPASHPQKMTFVTY